MKKRVLSVMLCILMCMAILPPFGAIADTQQSSLDDSLIIHYDFEGSTAKEQLSDKALAGNCLDDLLYQSDKGENDSSVTYGVAHLASTNGSAIERRRQNSGFSTDVETLTDGMTVYLKMKISGTTTGGISDIMDIGNVMRLYVTGTTPALKVRFTSDAYNAVTHEITIGSITKDEYFYVAITTSYNSAAQQLTAKTYLSEDGLTYGTSVQKTFEKVANFYAAAAADWKGIRFGLPCHFGDRTVIGTEFDFDDVRVYNRALGATELAEINTSTPALRAVQTSAVNTTAQTYGIRLVSTLGADLREYTKVGYMVSYSEDGLTYSADATLEGQMVYTSLLADSKTGMTEAVGAQKIGGAYIFAYAITDIPTTVTDFQVTMFAVRADGHTTDTFGTYSLTFSGGTFASARRVDREHLIEKAEAYRALHGTYGAWIEKIVAQLKNGTEREEILLTEALVARLGSNSFAVKVGNSSVLYDGYVQKLDPENYSRTAKYESNKVLIPIAFAKTYFGSAVTGDINGYFDLTSYCNSNSGKYTLSYISASGIAVCTPTGDTIYTDSNAYVNGFTNQQYLNCMNGFFENTLLPEPTTNTEQSRVVLASAPYKSDVVYDYSKTVYEVNASPSILKVTEGGREVLYASYQSYVTLNDLSEYNNVVYLQRSTDAGKTWTEVASVKNLRWQTMAEIGGKLYLVGCACNTNRVMVASYDPATGNTASAVFDSDEYFLGGSGPCASLIKNGRLYVAFNLGVASIDISKDLLTPSNWTISNSPTDLMLQAEFESQADLSEQLGNKTLAQFSMEEGNVIAGKDGKLYVMYRVNAAPTYGRAVLFELSTDGTTLSNAQVIKFPTAQSKFSVRYDESTGYYISIVSMPTEHASHQRNVLAMAVSQDLVNWTVVDTLLVDRQMLQFNVSRHKHSYQYADFAFVGDALIFTIRESSGDNVNKWHDGTYITVYTVANYGALIETALQNGGLTVDLNAACSPRPSYGLQ